MIDYTPLICNLVSLDGWAEELLRREFSALDKYLTDAIGGMDGLGFCTKICDIALSQDTDADYLIALGNSSQESLENLRNLLEDKPKETLLIVILCAEEGIKLPCPVFLTKPDRVVELLYDLTSLVGVRRYFSIDFKKAFDFFTKIDFVCTFDYDGTLSATKFQNCERCWVTIIRPDENLTADTTLMDEVLVLLPDDCEIIWNMRTSNKKERGVRVRLYC